MSVYSSATETPLRWSQPAFRLALRLHAEDQVEQREPDGVDDDDGQDGDDVLHVRFLRVSVCFVSSAYILHARLRSVKVKVKRIFKKHVWLGKTLGIIFPDSFYFAASNE